VSASDQTPAKPCRYQAALLPSVLRLLRGLPPGASVLDAGCGNGYLSGYLLESGFSVGGIDLSAAAIKTCQGSHPSGTFQVGSVCDPDLPRILGRTFDAIVSTEVIEHLYSPETFLKNCHALLCPGGILVLSTPYHGYLKNLVLALFNRWESHLQPNHEGGHIKFWSRRKLTDFLASQGFQVTGFEGSGRLPGMWKTMIIRAVREP
jgi:2-polyprenyl-3-methyl-5-hydroxy-6-metoxy-1,4-benzoquinol methylase